MDGRAAVGIIISDAHYRIAGDDGEPSSAGQQDAHESAPAADCNPHGAERKGRHAFDIPEDAPLNVEEVLQRFRSETSARFSKETSRRRIEEAWRRFVAWSKFDGYTKRKLGSSAGRTLLLEYFGAMLRNEVGGATEKSVRWNLWAIQTVWESGLRLPWPISRKKDIRKLPPIGRRQAPSDADVRPIAEALESELNVHRRLLVRLLLCYGLRPEDQIAELRWRHIVADSNGRPIGFVAQEPGFKTHSPIVAYIPPAVAADLAAWKALCPDTRPEAYILPKMNRAGNIRDPSKPHDEKSLLRMWRFYLEDHSVKSTLTPVHLRHWVKRHGLARGINGVLLAYWQGHDPKTEMGGMSGWYGANIPEGEILAEQEAAWADGPIGDLLTPRVHMDNGMPPEVTKLVQGFLAGQIDSTSLALRLGDLRAKSVSETVTR